MGMGGSTKASDAAAAADAARNASIQGTVGQIQSAYNSPSRQGQYDSYGKALGSYYTDQVNQQEAQNARNLKFANARSGLTGGSAAVDSNTQLQKDYTSGLLKASQTAQGGEAQLKNADANSENQMIALAQQGNYIGSIPQQTSLAQNASLENANSFGQANSLGNLFSNTGTIYQNEQTAAAQRAAQGSPIGSIYGTSAFGK